MARTRGPRIAGMLVAALFAAATPAAASTLLQPRPHSDAGETAASPLDLTNIALGQQGTLLSLRMRTARAWDPAGLSPQAGRTLCLRLFYGALTSPRARICATGTAGTPLLRYTRLDPYGAPHRVTTLAALVDRPDARTIAATFTPGAAGLPLGPFRWNVESRWTDDAAGCPAPAGCTDTMPDRGLVPARARLLAEPRCFGAAARAPRPCRNAALARTVEPRPADAVLEPNQFCLPIGDPSILNTCRFQTPPRFAVARTVALVGDSHAAHWRAALNIVATAKRWKGISITRSGCPFSAARPILPRADGRRCARFKSRLFAWLARHGEVRSVFVSGHIARVVDEGGGQWRTQVDGLRRAFRRLPRTVRDVFVIRDTPQTRRSTLSCVGRVAARRRPTARACAVPRRFALKPDPATVATRGLGRRFHVIDMSRYFCDRDRCFEVVGGALVHKDTAHITEVFSTTLGPYLLKRVNRLLRR